MVINAENLRRVLTQLERQDAQLDRHDGRAAVAPYSVRPHEGAPIAVPIEWDELKSKKLNAQTYNMKNIWKRMDKVGDLWKDMWKHAKSIKDASGKLDKMLEGIR